MTQGTLKTGRAATHYLVPISGPALEPFALPAREKPLTMGRHEACDLVLPATADKVSRFHVQFAQRENRWHVSDLKSRWGTFLNGRQLAPGEAVALHAGDLLHIAPWTFSLSTSPAARGLKLAAEENQFQTMVRTHPGASTAPARSLGDDLLAILLESAAAIHNAADEKALAETVLDTASRGTGLRNGAMLRPLDARGTFEVLAAKNAAGTGEAGGQGGQGGATYSRTLIEAASQGDVAEFSTLGSANVAESIARMNVTAAVCVPLMLGSAVAAYLYLDSRGQPFTAPKLHTHATAFCAALGRIASLALANLKRVDMERRAALVEAELNAGAEAQRFILPQRTGTAGPFSYIGESKAGQYVGGDFFDVLQLDRHRFAVALADVAGKGIPASVLMAAAQGYLHSALQQHANLSDVARALNEFICPRCPANKFLTVFVAIVDAEKSTLTYVDAGHGYGLLRIPGGEFSLLSAESSLPIGISTDVEYPAATIAFPQGSELLIVSDGIIEQPAPSGENAPREQFDVAGVRATLNAAPPPADAIAALFSAVIHFANSTKLADDATAVLVKYATAEPAA